MGPEWVKFLWAMQRGVSTSPHPDWAGCDVSDKLATNHCCVSSHQRFEVWGAGGGSVIIQLNSVRENYSCVVAGVATIPPTPPAPQSPSSDINRHGHVRQHTPFHKMHRQTVKQACSCTCSNSVCVSQVQILKRNLKKIATVVQRHRSAHDHDAAVSQAGTAPEEVILFLFVQQRKGRGR